MSTLCCDVGMRVFTKPVCQRILAGNSRIKRVRVAGRNNGMENVPDRVAIRFCCLTNFQHRLCQQIAVSTRVDEHAPRYSLRPISLVLKSNWNRSKPFPTGSGFPLPESANCSLVQRTISRGLYNLHVPCIAVCIETDAKTAGPRYTRVSTCLGGKLRLRRIHDSRFGCRPRSWT